jgi:hypothetical protein
MNESYRELPVMHHGSPLDYDKVVKDTLHKWKFLTRWVKYYNEAHIDALKHKPSYKLVLQEILADEPLCFEAAYYPSVDSYCQACPFFWVTKKSCAELGSFKERVCRPFFSGKGIFKPFGVVKLLVKIKTGTVINDIEVLENVRKKSYTG